MNRIPTNESGVNGVNYVERIDRWTSHIFYNYKNIYLGAFKEKDDAINARKNAEEKYYGEYAYKEGVLQ